MQALVCVNFFKAKVIFLFFKFLFHPETSERGSNNIQKRFSLLVICSFGRGSLNNFGNKRYLECNLKLNTQLSLVSNKVQFLRRTYLVIERNVRK